jgi:hypothetical protein
VPNLDSAGSDGGTVTKERFDGLMSAYQRALGETRDLRAQYGSAPQGSGNALPQEQPDALEEGQQYQVVNGRLEVQEPPTARSYPQGREFSRAPREKSAADIRAEMHKLAGDTPSGAWPR